MGLNLCDRVFGEVGRVQVLLSHVTSQLYIKIILFHFTF